jgi:hypothetical protein
MNCNIVLLDTSIPEQAWLTTGQTADPNKLINITTNVQGHFRDMSGLATDLP